MQVFLYQITDEGTVLVPYSRIPINKVFWWGHYWGLLFNSHFTTPFYSLTYELAFYTTILNSICCICCIWYAILIFFFCFILSKKKENFEFSAHFWCTGFNPRLSCFHQTFKNKFLVTFSWYLRNWKVLFLNQDQFFGPLAIKCRLRQRLLNLFLTFLPD